MPSHSPCSQCSQPVPPLKQFRFQTEERLLPTHNYFLTFSPFLQLLNYAELFSLLFFFSKNASSVHCRNIYYLFSLYLLTFFFVGKKMDQLRALSAANTASSYSWLKQMLPVFKPVSNQSSVHLHAIYHGPKQQTATICTMWAERVLSTPNATQHFQSDSIPVSRSSGLTGNNQRLYKFPF